ncbi:unnamed protein product [Trichogramma brassicae]|uniref:Uncharacterized protein n=1 Tax=Trichogramma brassicae TaxID=86971 RepID=A0A6H5IJV6_9HYME|nr:unnamed protein product [Trichogramma brassicae]
MARIMCSGNQHYFGFCCCTAPVPASLPPAFFSITCYTRGKSRLARAAFIFTRNLGCAQSSTCCCCYIMVFAKKIHIMYILACAAIMAVARAATAGQPQGDVSFSYWQRIQHYIYLRARSNDRKNNPGCCTSCAPERGQCT